MIRKIFLILIFAITPLSILASPQMPDFIIYKKDTIATYNLILEKYLQKKDTANTNTLFGLSFRGNSSFNCWRGYQAIYKIENDSLFIVDIINCGELINRKIDKTQSLEKLKSIFGEKLKNDRVHIDWFEGILNFPRTNEVLRWDGVFYKIFEKEKLITISNGVVLKTEDVSNYIDDPKRKNRKDQKKISDIFFKKLKKEKWQDKSGADCGSKYLVTIDSNGNVSKVRMAYTDKEIEEFFKKDELDFCTSKILNALKSLKFDIIKDKGKPISEEIYIQIFLNTNGKIENWTN
ncbi:hypothetical protein HNP37_004362 [Flavobacterium nitrogenifigens]|uniref:Uncharacterized protein n=2 Tax=Flavobacterium TaxID=237 RepID=A0A7W7N8T1_9FLAO|nr:MULTISPECIES: hypothetical protein [Flavobacterium]MBB4804275.1 hypothetical protein [Flavobacterium nitrogenifigens]MBB6389329.1 hypothetical protein [Flavobacterium notoginsengisoli]